MLIDFGSLVDIMFLSAFQGLQLDPNNIGAFQGSLVSLLDKQVQVMGNIALKTTFGSGMNARTIEAKYLIVDATSP